MKKIIINGKRKKFYNILRFICINAVFLQFMCYIIIPSIPVEVSNEEISQYDKVVENLHQKIMQIECESISFSTIIDGIIYKYDDYTFYVYSADTYQKIGKWYYYAGNVTFIRANDVENIVLVILSIVSVVIVSFVVGYLISMIIFEMYLVIIKLCKKILT